MFSLRFQSVLTNNLCFLCVLHWLQRNTCVFLAVPMCSYVETSFPLRFQYVPTKHLCCRCVFYAFPRNNCVFLQFSINSYATHMFSFVFYWLLCISYVFFVFSLVPTQIICFHLIFNKFPSSTFVFFAFSISAHAWFHTTLDVLAFCIRPNAKPIFRYVFNRLECKTYVFNIILYVQTQNLCFPYVFNRFQRNMCFLRVFHWTHANHVFSLRFQ